MIKGQPLGVFVQEERIQVVETKPGKCDASPDFRNQKPAIHFQLFQRQDFRPGPASTTKLVEGRRHQDGLEVHLKVIAQAEVLAATEGDQRRNGTDLAPLDGAIHEVAVDAPQAGANRPSANTRRKEAVTPKGASRIRYPLIEFEGTPQCRDGSPLMVGRMPHLRSPTPSR